MTKILLAIGVAILVSACAPLPRYAYVKDGASKMQTETDMSKCEYQIQLQKTAPGNVEALKKLCMEGQGYRLRRVN